MFSEARLVRRTQDKYGKSGEAGALFSASKASFDPRDYISCPRRFQVPKRTLFLVPPPPGGPPTSFSLRPCQGIPAAPHLKTHSPLNAPSNEIPRLHRKLNTSRRRSPHDSSHNHDCDNYRPRHARFRDTSTLRFRIIVLVPSRTSHRCCAISLRLLCPRCHCLSCFLLSPRVPSGTVVRCGF